MCPSTLFLNGQTRLSTLFLNGRMRPSSLFLNGQTRLAIVFMNGRMHPTNQSSGINWPFRNRLLGRIRPLRNTMVRRVLPLRITLVRRVRPFRNTMVGRVWPLRNIANHWHLPLTVQLECPVCTALNTWLIHLGLFELFCLMYIAFQCDSWHLFEVKINLVD